MAKLPCLGVRPQWFKLMQRKLFKILIFKVHIFREGHKILRNLPLTFDCMYCSQKLEDFAKFCGLLRIFELYQINLIL
jgi:hypothetical protein